jgi:hypothetical protein
MRFGIAIAAMIRIMATTIKSSIKEKPDWLRFIGPGSPIPYLIRFSYVVLRIRFVKCTPVAIAAQKTMQVETAKMRDFWIFAQRG